MESFLTGAAILLVALTVVVWRSVRRPITRNELRRRIQALDERSGGQDATWVSRRSRVGRRLQPIIGRRTIAQIGGLAGLAIVLLVGFVWSDECDSATRNEARPAALPAAPVGDGARGTLFDLSTARLAPVRLELAVVGLGDVWPLRAPVAPVPVDAPAPRLSVARSGVGTDIVDRELVGRSDSFTVGTRVAFWTHVTGGSADDLVRHVWFHQDRMVGAVDLVVGSPSWRTLSRRLLTPSSEGDWVVEVRDVEGRVLARHGFRCERLGHSSPERIDNSAEAGATEARLSR